MDHPAESPHGLPLRLPQAPGTFERILDGLAAAVTVTEADGRLVFANAAALERMRFENLEEALAERPEELLAHFDITREDGSPLDPNELPGRRLLRGEEPRPVLLRLIDREDGRLFWTMVKATELVDDAGHRLAVNVLEDVTEPKEQELRARFLSQASELLGSSLDFEESVRQVAALAVPMLADWCAVDLLEHGEIRQVAVAHTDPAKLAFAEEFRRRYPPSLSEPTGVGAVLRSGEPEFYPAIPDEMLVAGARDEEHLGLVRELQMRSVIIVPMRSRGRAIGAITLVAAESAGRLDELDLVFAQDFAARAASALENARLYRERTRTVVTLQRSLLPARLAQVPGWQIATLYRAGEEGSEIGGDFYDIFPTQEGFTAIMGDVTGKGVAAASLTALTRHSARAAAVLGLEPARILRLLNDELINHFEFSLVTAIVARLTRDQEGAELTLASGGHPLPLRHRPGAPPVELGRPGTLLGLDTAGSWPEEKLLVEPGDTLLFYTDGVTDTIGGDGRFGERRLLEFLPTLPADPNSLLRALDGALRDFSIGGAQDDVALLAARLEAPEPD